MTVRGITEARAGLERARRHLDAGQDLVLRDLADLFRKGEDDVFRTQGAVLGTRWRPLKPSTVKSRTYLIKRFGLQITPTEPVLVQFGDMRDALRHKGGAQEQHVGRSEVRITIDTARINRHDRKKGLGMALTGDGQRRRKPRGKGAKRYPEDILDVHEKKGRVAVGVPGYIHFEQGERVKRFLDNVAGFMQGGESFEGGSGWEGWHD